MTHPKFPQSQTEADTNTHMAFSLRVCHNVCIPSPLPSLPQFLHKQLKKKRNSWTNPPPQPLSFTAVLRNVQTMLNKRNEAREREREWDGGEMGQCVCVPGARFGQTGPGNVFIHIFHPVCWEPERHRGERQWEGERPKYFVSHFYFSSPFVFLLTASSSHPVLQLNMYKCLYLLGC